MFDHFLHLLGPSILKQEAAWHSHFLLYFLKWKVYCRFISCNQWYNKITYCLRLIKIWWDQIFHWDWIMHSFLRKECLEMVIYVFCHFFWWQPFKLIVSAHNFKSFYGHIADRTFKCSFPIIVIFPSLHGLIAGILFALHISGWRDFIPIWIYSSN